MAATIKGVSGYSIKFHVRFWEDKEKTQLVDTSGYSARLELRATQSPSRVLLSTTETLVVDPDDIPPGTTFGRIEPGHWRVFLGKSQTRTLPPSVRFEIELVNLDDPEDVMPVCSGTIAVQPQVVTNVE